MKIAITGATGHIATSVIPLLLEKGYQVRALVNSTIPSIDVSNIEIVKGNLFNISSLQDLVASCDVVIHCAAKISIHSNSDASVYETNVQGTQNVFLAAKNARVKRFIHVSSIHAYHQLPISEILNETRAFCFNNAPRYDQSKRDAQKFVLKNAGNKMDVIVVNPTCVIGPNDYRPSLMGQAMIDMYNKKMPSLIDGGFDFCDVRDVAKGIVNAIEKGRSGQAYLLSGEWHHLRVLHRVIMEFKKTKRNILVLPIWTGYVGLPFIQFIASMRNLEPLYTEESLEALANGNKKISAEKAMEDLNYTIRPFSETVVDTMRWFKESSIIS